MVEAVIEQRSPWAGLARAGRFGAGDAAPGVTMRPVGRAGFTHLAARRGAACTLIEAAGVLKIDLPKGPKWGRSGGRLVVWAGPDQWLIRGASPDDAVPLALEPLAPHALVIDQSHARALVTIAGHRARDVLSKGLEIDLHPRAFATGDVALATAAHIPALIWQADAGPTFCLAVPRSYANSTWHWLTEAAAEYGFAVEAAEVPADDGEVNAPVRAARP